MEEIVQTAINVIVEGNIGSGKSTLLDSMENEKDIEVFLEPVDKWCNLRGTNLLNLMYENPEQWTVPFQSYAFLTMMQNHGATTQKKIKIMERSIYSIKNCFLEVLKNKNKELHPVIFEIFDEWFRYAEQSSKLKVDLIIYLRTSPEISLKRISERGRNEEGQVTLEYLQQLHELHECWLLEDPKFRVLVLDGNKNQHQIVGEYVRARKEITQLAGQSTNDNCNPFSTTDFRYLM